MHADRQAGRTALQDASHYADIEVQKLVGVAALGLGLFAHQRIAEHATGTSSICT